MLKVNLRNPLTAPILRYRITSAVGADLQVSEFETFEELIEFLEPFTANVGEPQEEVYLQLQQIGIFVDAPTPGAAIIIQKL